MIVVGHVWALLRRVHTVSVSLVSDDYTGRRAAPTTGNSARCALVAVKCVPTRYKWLVRRVVFYVHDARCYLM